MNNETQAVENQMVPDIIPTGSLPTISESVITKRHIEIGEEFLSRVKGLISHVPSQIKDYAVKRAQASWDSNDETISLLFKDNSKLIIKLETKDE